MTKTHPTLFPVPNTMAAAAAELNTFEVEIEQFGFSPITVVDLVINAINDYVLDGADALRDYLSKTKKLWSAEELWRTISAILGFVQDVVDRNMDRFELYCFTQIFPIPAMMTLPSDLPQIGHAPTAADEAQLDEELLALRRRLRRAAAYRAVLQAERDNLKAAVARIDTAALQRQQAVAVCKRLKVPFVADNVTFLVDSARQVVAAGTTLSLSIAKTPARRKSGGGLVRGAGTIDALRSVKRKRAEVNAPDLSGLAERL